MLFYFLLYVFLSRICPIYIYIYNNNGFIFCFFVFSKVLSFLKLYNDFCLMCSLYQFFLLKILVLFPIQIVLQILHKNNQKVLN